MRRNADRDEMMKRCPEMQIMAKQTRFRTFQIKRNGNLSVPIGNLVWAQAFFERFGLDEVIRAFKTKGTDLAS